MERQHWNAGIVVCGDFNSDGNRRAVRKLFVEGYIDPDWYEPQYLNGSICHNDWFGVCARDLAEGKWWQVVYDLLEVCGFNMRSYHPTVWVIQMTTSSTKAGWTTSSQPPNWRALVFKMGWQFLSDCLFTMKVMPYPTSGILPIIYLNTGNYFLQRACHAATAMYSLKIDLDDAYQAVTKKLRG